MQSLISKNIVKQILMPSFNNGYNGSSSNGGTNGTSGLKGETAYYTRVTENDTQIKLVKQMPKVIRSQQPTIAIITAQYCEKLAVDSMIDNKDTYVKYKTEGQLII